MPFHLVEGDSIIAIVQAMNAVGYSIPSNENTNGAK